MSKFISTIPTHRVYDRIARLLRVFPEAGLFLIASIANVVCSFYGTNSTKTFDHGLSARYPMSLLFSSIHCYLDPSSGTALCTRKLLELLAGRGMDCRALTTGILNPERETSHDDGLAALELPARRFQAMLGTSPEGVRPSFKLT